MCWCAINKLLTHSLDGKNRLITWKYILPVNITSNSSAFGKFWVAVSIVLVFLFDVFVAEVNQLWLESQILSWVVLSNHVVKKVVLKWKTIGPGGAL